MLDETRQSEPLPFPVVVSYEPLLCSKERRPSEVRPGEDPPPETSERHEVASAGHLLIASDSLR